MVSWSKPVSGQEICIDLLHGPYHADLTKRKNKRDYIERLLDCQSSDEIQGPVISGWWYAMLRIMDTREGDSKPDYHYYLPLSEIEKAKESGLRIFALPEQAEINAHKYGYDNSAVAVTDYPCP
jgi:hypothetical protein